MRRLVLAGWYLSVCASVAWLLAVGRSSVEAGAHDGVAVRISRGEAYPPAALAELLDRAGPPGGRICDEGRARSDALIAVRLAELTLAAGRIDQVDGAYAAAERHGRRLVACSPRQAFGWLVLYWVAMQSGRHATPENLALLDLTYALAPYEVWIAARRAYLGASVFADLPSGLQGKVVRDFGLLLRAGAVPEAAGILGGAAYAARDAFLRETRAAPDQAVSALAQALRANGSGIELPDR